VHQAANNENHIGDLNGMKKLVRSFALASAVILVNTSSATNQRTEDFKVGYLCSNQYNDYVIISEFNGPNPKLRVVSKDNGKEPMEWNISGQPMYGRGAHQVTFAFQTSLTGGGVPYKAKLEETLNDGGARVILLSYGIEDAFNHSIKCSVVSENVTLSQILENL